MPTPYGTISTSEGPVTPDEPALKKFKVIANYKVRYVIEVTAESAAEAEGKIIDRLNDGINADILISDYSSEVEEL